MEDGYFDNYGRFLTVILCTESFTKTDCELLQEVLESLGIKSSLKVRNSAYNTYRTRISKTSMPLLRELGVVVGALLCNPLGRRYTVRHCVIQCKIMPS